jgi:hypothetical protein
MTLPIKILLTVKSAIAAILLIINNQNSHFVYLNNPETLKSTGILHQKTFYKKTNVRYFFHYLNGTKKPQIFSITSNQKVDNLKKSINTNESPEMAGAFSVKNFLSASTKNEKINFQSNVMPDDTISGIIEGNFNVGDTVTYSFGNQKETISSYDICQSSYIFDVPLQIDLNQTSQYKLGFEKNSTVKGQYGSNINIIVTPKQNGLLKLSFNPRGGAGLLVFSNRGKIFITKLMPAFKKYDVFMISVEKGKKETFTFIPCGGLNYPINLDFSLQSYELNPDIA